ncbi:MAG: tetratricopeptide repeat protein [Armatimonadota bacterium]
MDEALVEQALAEGVELIQNQQLAQGVDKLSRLVRALPRESRMYELAWAQLSAAYQQQGKLRKAIAALRRAIKSAPKNPHYRLSLANMYRELGDGDRALAEARKAARLSPELLEARELFAELLLENGLLETTLSEASEILRLSPNNVRALDLMGTAYLYQGRTHQALRIVERLVRLCPADPSHHLKRAILLQQAGCTAEAIQSYLQVVEMAPDTDLARQAAESVRNLDEHQIRQIVVLAASDPMFRTKLLRDPVAASQERGFILSPEGQAVLEHIRFETIPSALMEWHYRTYN